MSGLNPAQERAAQHRGNVVVSAGAGTGKTRTLVERCLFRLLDPRQPTGIDQFLIVTFTEAAAAEMRRRLAQRLAEEETRQPSPRRDWIAQQRALLDTAAIGTLHGFCARLLREHFHLLDLDPGFTVLDEGEAAVLALETWNDLLRQHADPTKPDALRLERLARTLAGGSIDRLWEVNRRLHAYARSLPRPRRWLEEQRRLWRRPTPEAWEAALLQCFRAWRQEWLEAAATQPDLAEPFEPALARLRRPMDTLQDARAALAAWTNLDLRGAKRRTGLPAKELPLYKVRDQVKQLLEALLHPGPHGPSTPEHPFPGLWADWDALRPEVLALLDLVLDFDTRFTRARRQAGAVDFGDLEQLALELLVTEEGRPTPLARELQQRFECILVDEYQDINAAQDSLLSALGRPAEEGNRFLVGDLKQSIYGFRLAQPQLFRGYTTRWAREPHHASVSLQTNYRSHPQLLGFLNDLFAWLMRPEVGEVDFDATAHLQPGRPETSTDPSEPVVEVLLGLQGNGAATSAEPLSEAGEEAALGNEVAAVAAERPQVELEATLVAHRLRQLHDQPWLIPEESGGLRPVAWSDMAVLLRAPANQTATYARVFDRMDIPLVTRGAGLYAALECQDLLNLLRILDNPRQDLPLLAVLRSPFGGFSTDHLSWLRCRRRQGPLWSALTAMADSPPTPARPGLPAEALPLEEATRTRAARFLQRYRRWRALARQEALSAFLETLLAETRFEELLLIGERGEQRRANLRRLVVLARRFDQFQRQSVHRFLRFIEAQQRIEFDPEPASAAGRDAVHLLSIHQSKGLEFPVVVLAGLGQRFNEQDLRGPLLIDEELGLCPVVTAGHPPRHYPSGGQLLARHRLAARLRGEELRLLYVGMTRAAHKLILSGLVDEKRLSRWKSAAETVTASRALSLFLRQATCPWDWLGPWLTRQAGPTAWEDATGQAASGLFIWTRTTAPPLPDTQPDSPLPSEKEDPAGASLRQQLEQTTFAYPHQPATRESAKASVSRLRRRTLEEDPEEESRPWFVESTDTADPFPPLRLTGDPHTLSAAERGTAHHRFLQHARLQTLSSREDIQAEAARLVAAGLLAPEERDSLDWDGLSAFGRSQLAQRLQSEPPEHVRREFEFTFGFRPSEADALGIALQPGLPEEEVLVVQGIVDVAVFGSEGLWILDFKTDRLEPPHPQRPDPLETKARLYQPQLSLYALALSRIHHRPVREAWLFFLSARRAVQLPLPEILHSSAKPTR